MLPPLRNLPLIKRRIRRLLYAAVLASLAFGWWRYDIRLIPAGFDALQDYPASTRVIVDARAGFDGLFLDGFPFRGQVFRDHVVFCRAADRSPSKASGDLIIGRVYGMPGDRVFADDQAQVVVRRPDGAERRLSTHLWPALWGESPLTVPAGHYLVLVDDGRAARAIDSRAVGMIARADIEGRVLLAARSLLGGE